MKKYIHAYITDNGTCFKDISSWATVKEAIKISFNLTEDGYENVSSIFYWEMFGKDFEKKSQIKLIYEETDWGSISLEEKKIVAKYFLIEKEKRNEVLTEEEQKNAWDQLVQNSLNYRFERWSKAKSYISYILSPMDSSDLAFSCSELCLNYINYNITSYAQSGKSGLYDFIEGTADYTGLGFPAKTYWKKEYQDTIMSILKI